MPLHRVAFDLLQRRKPGDMQSTTLVFSYFSFYRRKNLLGIESNSMLKNPNNFSYILNIPGYIPLDYDKVCLLTHFDRSDLAFQPHSPGIIVRGYVDGFQWGETPFYQ